MSGEDKSKSWYAHHPLVSTFLWVLGNSANIEPTPELSPQHNGNSSRLHWKDEHDGDICSVIVEDSGQLDKSNSNSCDANSNTSGSRKSIERSGSGTVLKRSESGKMTTFNSESRIFQSSEREYGSDNGTEFTESPQWGWYVSTTPPSRDHRNGPVDPGAVQTITQLRNSYYEPPPKTDA